MRILLIPFFVMEVIYYVKTSNEMHRLGAILCFAFASLCDGLDGYIARKYHQVSELGTILDPLADKLLLVSGIIVLSFTHGAGFAAIPLWLTGTILGRDGLVLLGLGVLQLMIGKVTVRPRVLGKIATVLQMVVVLWILLKWDAKWLTIWIAGAAIGTIGSGLLYLWDWTRQVSAHPSASPKN
jgi:CDP-diacylglycerol--glycerol-3-phosphate 3-phosphatidyltransferase